MSMSNPVVKMYAPNGAEVYIPLSGDVAQAVARLERLGLSPVPLGDHERERRTQVGYFAVRSHVNGDGTETPVVDLYFRYRNGWVDRMRSMRVYLNSRKDIAKFEDAFGVRLQHIKILDSSSPLDRGKLRPGQEEFLYRPACPVWVVWRLNPASESDEQAPKRLFVRWERGEECAPASSEQQTEQAAAPPTANGQLAAHSAGAQANNATPAAERATNNDDTAERHHFSSAEIVSTVSRVWGLPPAKVVPALYAEFKDDKYLTVAEAVAWAEANRPDAA